jgi:hypothetical protein
VAHENLTNAFIANPYLKFFLSIPWCSGLKETIKRPVVFHGRDYLPGLSSLGLHC